MKKILYIAPENVVGNLNIWKHIHESRGNQCRFITYFKSLNGFPEDICLNLPLVSPAPWFLATRKMVYRFLGGPKESVVLDGHPPVWSPSNPLISTFFKFRDALWKRTVEQTIEQFNLLDFDILHLETGLEFYRNGSFIKRFKQQGKPILNTFHGIELRHRGVIPEIDRITDLNLTSEVHLLPMHPNLKYLPLPFDVQRFKPKFSVTAPITICHATRNRHFKGSDEIIRIGRELEKSHNIRFLLIENESHDETLKLKQTAHIYIDQVADIVPGYGMNSIEAMSMGLVCCTSMNAEWQQFVPEHPFIHVTSETLKTELIRLIEHPETITEKGRIGRDWVGRFHSLNSVGDQLYQYYQQLGISIDE
ncbi:MAG: hypothetical protein HQ510_10690 [Candidatus Marinimicrobia bacterium]|nr:hypothetical protein [Candidatus Neomarinimicrobiota bacterium]